jgi:hypothetical protein
VRRNDEAQGTQCGLLWSHFVFADLEGIDQRPSTSMPCTNLHSLAARCAFRGRTRDAKRNASPPMRAQMASFTSMYADAVFEHDRPGQDTR